MSYDLIILITGDRKYQDKNFIHETLSEYKNKKCLLIHGGCTGADTLAGIVGKELKFDIQTKPANWKKFGRAAGPIRNKEMINEVLIYKKQNITTIVLAFHNDLENSKGTKNCINQAIKSGLEVYLCKPA
jgi:hypothetical protein